jgi:hypothetical protein
MDATTPRSAVPNTQSFWNMRRVRQWHNYIGVFFAPAILFFVVSGALQTLGLHESRGDASYKPPGWIVTLASVHKDQTLPRIRAEHAAPVADRHEHEPVAPQGHGESHAGPQPGPSPWPLKIFVLCLALGLGMSALLGITISLKNKATRQTSLILLAVGTVLPVALLFL